MIIRNAMRTVLLLAALAGSTAQATNIYTFGDSLVDAGNVFLATGGANPAAADGYFMGRFSNGFDYTDLLQLRFSGSPTAPSLLGGLNFAWGGSRAVGPTHGGFPTPGMPEQLGAYLAASGGVGDPNGVYIINFGGNDAFGLGSGDIGALTPAEFVALATSNIATAVTTLSAIGAGTIVVTGNPVGTAAGFALDGALQSALDSLEPGLQAKLLRFSYYDFYGRLLSDPTAYNFPAALDTVTPCRSVRPVINGTINCSGFFSFDGVHFTDQVHRAIARDMVQLLGVPEPATWGLMIAGFGMVGFAARRQQRRMNCTI